MSFGRFKKVKRPEGLPGSKAKKEEAALVTFEKSLAVSFGIPSGLMFSARRVVYN